MSIGWEEWKDKFKKIALEKAKWDIDDGTLETFREYYEIDLSPLEAFYEEISCGAG